MSAKKNKQSVLGPRGRRRLGLAKGENYIDRGGDSGGYIGSQRKARASVEGEGFGVFPKSWLDHCNVQPKERRSTKFVLPNPRGFRGAGDVNEWETAKLATSNKVDTFPTYSCLNPFIDAMPGGDGKPLPR